MEKLRRTVFFWMLTAIFLITAPLVVLRARGYRFDTSRGVFVHSGSINIKSNPQSVDVSLNGKLVQAKTLSRINNSYNISGLIPREYSLIVSANDFQSWDKKTKVHSGISSEFWNILLVRNNYEKIAHDTSGIQKFFISPKDKFVIFNQAIENGMVAKILDIKGNEIKNVFPFPGWNLLDEAKKENIEWSPEEDYLSVPVQRTSPETAVKTAPAFATEKKTEYAYFILDPAEDNFFNLNDFLGKADIRNVRWDPRDRDYLFFLLSNSLYRANIKEKDNLSLIAEDVSSYELSKTDVYFSRLTNQLVYKSSLDGKSDKYQITDNFPEVNSLLIDKLIIYDESRIAFLNSDKRLFIYNKGEHGNYFRKLSDNIEGMQFSNDGKKIIYWTKNEISVYFLRDWNVQPTRSENEIQGITRYSEELKNVQWFKDYEHIIFSSGAQIKIIELDSRDHRNTMDLPRLDIDNSFIVYNNSLEKLFFIDKGPASDNVLYSIIFPEKTSILGF
ncbi:MAG: hypothetical protein AAB487_01800 [Patescibacteria group bacterium]